MTARARVQAGPLGPAGTISWPEHVEAWQGYAQRFPSAAREQDADVIHRRGGFGHGELRDFLGHKPTTFEPGDT